MIWIAAVACGALAYLSIFSARRLEESANNAASALGAASELLRIVAIALGAACIGFLMAALGLFQLAMIAAGVK
jgi:hypothetical protein